MNKRPTPETDALWHKMNTGNSQPSWWVAAERMRDHAKQMERERDEAREALRELWQTADAYIPQIDEEQTTKWHNAMFGNSKNG
jgi:hypothetical protein